MGWLAEPVAPTGASRDSFCGSYKDFAPIGARRFAVSNAKNWPNSKSRKRPGISYLCARNIQTSRQPRNV